MKHFTLLSCLLFFTFYAPAKDIQQPKPLSFVENKGQITDQHFKSRKDIDFKLEAPGLNIFVGKGQIHYQWARSNPDSTITSYRMDVQLAGCNPDAAIEIQDAQDYYETYYNSNLPDGAVAHSCNKVVYRNIYPGIDWVLYSKKQTLKYDFVVHHNGDARNIQLAYKGADKLFIENGTLSAATPFGTINEAAPITIDAATRTQVLSAFVLNGNTISFDVEKNSNIIIDPTIAWATYYGGTGADWGMDVAADGAGNIYMVGATSSFSNIATTGSYQSTQSFGSSREGFAVKFNATGIRQWATYYGDAAYTLFSSIAIDLSGNLYFGGTSNAGVGIASSGAHQTVCAGMQDAILAKFSPAGTRLWATFYGGSNDEPMGGGADERRGTSVVCDALNNVYMSGSTLSNNGIATSGSFQASLPAITNIRAGYLVKFNSTGVRQWGTYYGGGSFDHISGIACDKNNNIIVCGIGNAANLSTIGSYPGLSFIGKFSSSGARLWGEFFPATNWGTCVATDINDNIYLSGRSSLSTPVTPGCAQSFFATDFLAKFSAVGDLQWSTFTGGSSAHDCARLVCNGYGNIFLTGIGAGGGIDRVSTPCTYKSGTISLQTEYDAYISIYDTLGSLLWSTEYRGNSNGYDWGWGVAYSSTKDLYSCGMTESTNGISTVGSHQPIYSGGGSDAYLVKFSLDTSVYISHPFLDTFQCAGQSFQLKYGTLYAFNTGNVFTVQLSDASGSFASPVTIGSAIATIGGFINCTIPQATLVSSGYRIRVVASNPFRVSCDDGFNIRINNVLPAFPIATYNNPLCEKDTLKLSSTTVTGVTYSWSGPNNYSASTQNPKIPLASLSLSGDYIIKVSLNGCVARDTVTVNVNPLPSLPAASSNTPVCINDTIKLTGGSTSGTVYSWTGPASFTSTQQNPMIYNADLTNAGNYILTLNLNGCIAKDTETVIINNVFPAKPLASSNSAICEGDTLKLSALSITPGVSYSWSGPNSFTSTLQNPLLPNAVGAATGDYMVKAVYNGCVMRDTETVLIKPMPVLTAGSNSPVCAGDTLKLTASSSLTGTGFNWTGPNSFTAAVANPNIANTGTAASGDYYVTNTLNGCSVRDTLSIQVKLTPVATAGSNAPVCEGSTLNFSGTSSMTGVSYSWTGPAYTSSVQNPFISNASVSNSGNYIFSASINGCAGKDTIMVVVNPVPIVTTSSNSPVCTGNAISLFSNSSVSGCSYNWSGPASYSSSVQNPIILNAGVANGGLYIVTASKNGCTSLPDSVTIVMAVSQTPVVTAYISPGDTICEGTTVVFLAQALNAGSAPAYQWIKNGVAIAGANGVNYVTTSLKNHDSLRCLVTSSAGCATIAAASSNTFVMTVFPNLMPSVSFTANPTGPLAPGQTVNFTAHPVNGGPKPTYQWRRNGVDVIGATSDVWSAFTLSDNDSIYVVLYSSERCPKPANVNSSNGLKIHILTGVGDVTADKSLQLYPNPNDGRFRLKATVSSNEAATICILNAVGQLVYQDKVPAMNQSLNTNLDLSVLPNGVYLLKLSDELSARTVRFTIER